MAGGKGKISPADNPKPFTKDNQPENRGRKPDPFKQALEDLKLGDSAFVVGQHEVPGLIDLQTGADGLPVFTIKGQWAEGKDGEDQQKVAILVVQMPEAHVIVAQWARDARSRQANIRQRARETLFDRVLGKPTQPLANDKENPLIEPSIDYSALTLEEKKQMLKLATKAQKKDAK